MKVMTILSTLWGWIKGWWDKVALFVLLILFFEVWGIQSWLYLLAFFFLYAIIKLWRNRKIFYNATATLETTVFGKPLIKKKWKKGELKKLRIETQVGKRTITLKKGGKK